MALQTADKLPDGGKTNDQYHDPIAVEVGRRLLQAQHWRASDKIMGVSVEQTLVNSYEQYHSIYSACDRDLIEQTGIDLHISITGKKCRVLEAFMRDLTGMDPRKLVDLQATPIPELPETAMDKVADELRDALAQVQGELTEDTIMEMASELKEIQLQREIIHSQKEARKQTKAVSDHLTTIGFTKEYAKFIHHLGMDPYAVMVGPIRRGQTVMGWGGGKIVHKFTQNDFIQVPDPRDYFYAPDACGGGTGQYEIIQETVSRSELSRSKGQAGWITKNVERAIESHCRNTMSDSYQGGREQRQDYTQADPDRMPAIRHFGKFSGEELRPYGLSLEPDMQYEVMSLVIAGYCCRIEVNVDPTTQQRRVFTTSYQDIPGRIPGIGVAQLCRPIERAFLKTLRDMLQNSDASAMPMGEVDFTRIQRFMDPESIGAVMTNTIMPVDPDPIGGGAPAHRFHSVPNLANQMMGAMDYFEGMADQYTGLPASLHGQPIGTGANRTFRGMLNLQGNAAKIIQSAFMNVDMHVLHPMLEVIHMIVANRSGYSGDAQITGSGVTGLLRKELKKQGAFENLQAIGQLTAAAPSAVPQGVPTYAANQVLESMDIPQSVLDTPTFQPPEQQPT